MDRNNRCIALIIAIIGFIFSSALGLTHYVVKHASDINPGSEPVRRYILFSSLMYLFVGMALCIFQRKKLLFNFIWTYTYLYEVEVFCEFSNTFIFILQMIIDACLLIVSCSSAYYYFINHKAGTLKRICVGCWLLALLIQIVVSVLLVHQSYHWLPNNMLNAALIIIFLFTMTETIPFMRRFATAYMTGPIMSALLIIIAAIYTYSYKIKIENILVIVMCYIPNIVLATTFLLYGYWLHYSKSSDKRISTKKCAIASVLALFCGVVYMYVYLRIDT